MKPVSRRSVTAGLAAAVTAIPALGLASREQPMDRINRLTRELEDAMREAYGGEIKTLTYLAPGEGINPHVMVAATGGDDLVILRRNP